MFKTAVIAAALVQASATKIESFDHNNKAVNPQMVEAINVSFCPRRSQPTDRAFPEVVAARTPLF
jgi:hypothetical protein